MRGLACGSVVLGAVLVAGCGGSGTTSATTAPSAQATAGPTAASTGTATLPVLAEGDPRPIPAGSYVSGASNLFPGLAITIPDGWTATETDFGEIGLHPVGHPDESLELWTNMVAVVTNNRSGTVGKPLPDVGHTAKDIVTWLTTTTDFRIIEAPAQATIGAGIHGTQLTVGVSDTANFALNDCPDNPRCAAILTQPDLWNGNFWAIGGDELGRVFVTDVGSDTFYVVLDAPNPDALAALAKLAEPIIASLSLP